MKRPESRLAAGGVLCAMAMAMLISVSLVSCEDGGGAAIGRGAVPPTGSGPEFDGPGGDGIPGSPSLNAPGGGSVSGPADFRVAAVGAEPEMRVRLLAGVERVTIGAPSLHAASGLQGSAINPARSPVLHGPVVVRRSANLWIITAQGGGAPLATFPAGDGAALGLASGAGGEVTVNSAAYPGRIWLIARSDMGDRAFDLIEHIGLEAYLPGVVAKEMLSGWPPEAYRVQAVCARTYALHERARTLGTGLKRACFDVESTERDQAYSGATRNRAAAEAVRATRGMVLADGDRVLRAYYSSTCGGRTASAADTWPTGAGFEFNLAGPIQACARETACQGAPLYRWTVRRDRAELVQRLRAFGEKSQSQVRQIADLWAIEPLTFNANGRPSAFKVIEPGGKWYRLSGEQLRLAMNQSVQRSALGMLDGPVGAAAAYGESSRSEGDGGDLLGPAPAAEETMTAPPDIDRRTRVMSSDLEVSGPKGQVGGAVAISGRGFGHGVGMCQYCAKAFADRGEDWRTMLLRFYPGARILPAY